jgi:hypothetical protein
MRRSLTNKALLSLAILGCVHMHGRSQLRVDLRSDQRVYVTGDDLWLDGTMDRVDTSSRWTRIRLLDRNGEMRAEATLRNDNGMFSGYLEIPETLPTDVYFLDAVPSVSASVTGSEPVYIVNPRIPQGSGCDASESKLGNASPAAMADEISIRIEKDTVDVRSPIEFSWSTGSGRGLREVFIHVVRQDALSEMMDSLCKGFSHPIRHDRGDPRMDLGHLIRARVTRNGTPVPGVVCFAALQDTKANIAVSESSADGMVEFLIPRSYDPSRLVVSTQSPSNGGLSLTLIDPDANPARIPFPCVRLNPSMRSDLEERILYSRLERRYHPEGVRSFDLSLTDSSDFYGKPDRRYILDDYTRFPVMEEVFTDIIPEVRVRKEAGAPVLQVLNTPMKTYFPRQGLVMLDGVPMADAQAVLDIDPLRIRAIDVVARTFTLGDIEFPGVVHLKSYKTDLAGNAPPKGSLSLPFPGVQRSSNHPETEDAGGRIGYRPSTRNLVFRQNLSYPESKEKDSIRLNTSDATGNHRICVYGIDGRGKRIKGEKSIFVREVR